VGNGLVFFVCGLVLLKKKRRGGGVFVGGGGGGGEGERVGGRISGGGWVSVAGVGGVSLVVCCGFCLCGLFYCCVVCGCGNRSGVWARCFFLGGVLWLGGWVVGGGWGLLGCGV